MPRISEINWKTTTGQSREDLHDSLEGLFDVAESHGGKIREQDKDRCRFSLRWMTKSQTIDTTDGSIEQLILMAR